ncbi:MAG: hypothetical protein U1F42_04925 [Candidatus Competibacteraceae bacterium]
MPYRMVSLTPKRRRTAIQNTGLTVGTVTQQASTTVAAGNVISQSQRLVAAGTATSIVVSSGPTIAVPNVVGLTQSAATTAIQNAGLTLGTVTQRPTLRSPPVTSFVRVRRPAPRLLLALPSIWWFPAASPKLSRVLCPT